MTDIDFDELDKAVNSLVGGVKDTSGGQKTENDAKSDTETISNDLPQDGGPKSENSNNTKPDLSSLLPKRRTGRFMDVVHSGSSAKQQDQPLATATPTRVIKPLATQKISDMVQNNEKTTDEKKNDTVNPIVVKSASQDEIVAETSSSDGIDTPSETEASKSSDMPDPLAGFVSEKEEQNSSQDADDQLKKPTNDEEMSDEASIPPTPSPFLEGTKPEKRPLGAFSENSDNDESENSLEGEFASAPKESAESEFQLAPDAAAESLPPELGKELVAIESGEIAEEPAKEAPKEAPEESAAKQDEQPAPSETSDEENKTEEKKESEEKSRDKAPNASEEYLLSASSLGSIPQQYKKAIEKRDNGSHPLFDPEHYHMPSNKTSQKKTSSKTVRIFRGIFIVVGLLLLGAVLGAGASVLTSQIL